MPNFTALINYFHFSQIAKRDITESLRDELSGDFLDALLLIGLCDV